MAYDEADDATYFDITKSPRPNSQKIQARHTKLRDEGITAVYFTQCTLK